MLSFVLGTLWGCMGLETVWCVCFEALFCTHVYHLIASTCVTMSMAFELAMLQSNMSALRCTT